MRKPIRILHVVSELNQGGIENFIMNIYRKIDKNKIQFDFIVHHKAKGFFEDEIESFGGNVYHFSFLDDKNIFKYKKDLKTFFKNHMEYDVIHGHLASIGFIYLSEAKKAGIKYRIAHSHGTATPKSFKGLIKSLFFKFFGKYANVKFACSTEAGEYMFKKKGSFKFIPNAIDFKRFAYDENVRQNLRTKYNLSDKFVIGHVGRFTAEKNHTFILHLFNDICKTDSECFLLLVGDGKLRASIHEKVNSMNMNDRVIFFGNRKDVEKIYNIMDVFILPSLFEGLPVTGVEAQVNGLPSLFSDNITREVSISKLAKFLSNDNFDDWKQTILSLKGDNSPNDHCNRKEVSISNKDFDIVNLVNKLSAFYLKCYALEGENE